jgi:serine/threonine-protein kinase
MIASSSSAEADDSPRATRATSGASSSRTGQIIADYRVLRSLGSGGMGEVYEVEHRRLGRAFAAKFLRADLGARAASVRRFESEARAMSMLYHPNVVDIVDIGQAPDGIPFFVMERLRGCDLRRLLDRHGSLTVPRAVGLVVHAARGLAAVHRAGLVHGDIKPANLFVCEQSDGTDCCKLLDFGLARSNAERAALPASGAGTVRYMAREQLAEGGEVDHRADIYALGAVLYECLLGCPPHVGERIEHVIYSVMHDEPSSLRDRGVLVPPELDRHVLRALSPDSNDRFSNASDLIDALLPFTTRQYLVNSRAHSAGDDTTTELRSSWLPAPRPSRRVHAVWFAAGVAAGALGIGLGRAPASTPASASAKSPVLPAPAATGSRRTEASSGTDCVRDASERPSPAAVGSANPPSRHTARSAKPEHVGNRQTPAASGRATSPNILGVFDAASPYQHENATR